MKRTSLRPFLVASAPNAAVSNVCEARNVPLLVQNKKKHMCKMHSFNRDSSPPLYT